MSDFYKIRTRNLYAAKSDKPYRLSRSKIDLFIECPRCFYLDRKLGVGRPPGYPFNLNSAVDELLKNEFDTHRLAKTVHPLVKAYGLNLVPFPHKYIEEWRDSLHRGVTYAVPDTNLVVTGGVDDVWEDPDSGEVIIVDYKATSKRGEVSLDADWQIGYKRQMEIYQWLFRRNGLPVSNTGYFVYCNGRREGSFDAKLEFDIKLIPYEGNDSWVEPAVMKAYACLCADEIPASNKDCDYCAYVEARHKAEDDIK